MPMSRKILWLAAALFLIAAANLCSAPAEHAENTSKKGKLLLLNGVDRYHDWQANSIELRKILEQGGFTVVICEEPWVFATEGMKEYDGIVMSFYNRDERWPAPVEEALVRLVREEGMGVGIIHSSDNSFPGWREYEEMVGLLWRTNDPEHKSGHDHYAPYTVKVVDKEHFITQGMDDFPVTDELYRDLTQYSDFHVLAQAFSRDKQRDYPIIMVKTYGKGRIFHTVLGHNTDSMLAKGFRRTTVQGMLWATGKDN